MRFTLVVLVAVLGTPAAATRSPDDLTKRLDLDRVWRITRGAGVTIGIVDTGFDFYHPALRGRLLPGSFAPGVFHSQTSVAIAHGTAVASVIGARQTPEMVGLAPDAALIAASQGMPDHLLLRLQSEAGGQSDVELQTLLIARRREVQAFLTEWVTYIGRSTSAGIRDLVERGVRVIALAQFLPLDQLEKYPEARRALAEAFDLAAARGVVIVLGAGNDDGRTERYPGRSDAVLVVGACDRNRQRWSEARSIGGRQVRQGSNYGPRLSVLAPAFDITIAVPHDPAFYALLDGPTGRVREPFRGPYTQQATGATSLAAAMVAALAGLVRAAAPHLDARRTIEIIEQSAIDAGPPGRDDETGHGIVDFGAAVERAARERAGPTALRR